MGLLDFYKNKPAEEITPVEAQDKTPTGLEKEIGSGTPSEKSHDQDSFSSNAQAGVKAIEAAATVWTKYHLIGAYVM